ncbi:presenilin, putative [Entamoeba invadens IP1]|uniref:Presenilin n=1 Tax=Entamoeba invadens IP1 TaxID=370355 RepID=A0A0A1U507_ENTIV|nr:presenilin, putative [Entamoeba invadens IP1]ELP89395.1 presenilin, putative [Entamoeba invadens IP1]|eukprot:XP_004256166.1 presenilin, putative [Entamoeba invadens IP1]
MSKDHKYAPLISSPTNQLDNSSLIIQQDNIITESVITPTADTDETKLPLTTKESSEEKVTSETSQNSENNKSEHLENDLKEHKDKKEEKDEEEEEPEPLTIEEYCDNVNSVITPVAITLFATVVIIKIMESSTNLYSQATSYVFSSTVESSTSIPTWLIAVIVTVVFIVMIVLVTFVFVLLFYFRCMKIIVGWLLLSVILLLMFFGGSIFQTILGVWNFPIDWISFSFLLFNFGVLGVVTVFYTGPMKLNQFYMITISVFMATIFTNLPEWTTWMLLIGMAIYDLIAVLCPKGPLRILVNLAQKREQPIPALIYSTAVWMQMADVQNEHDEVFNSSTNRFTLSEKKGRGIKLGLGDFVFYSVLVGRCAMYDLTIVFSASIAVLSGLFGTLILLVVFNKALPALPISIFFGTLIYVISRWALVPLVTTANLLGYVV